VPGRGQGRRLGRGTRTGYCGEGSVRRDRAQAGVSVHKLPGPPDGKREVLLATKP